MSKNLVIGYSPNDFFYVEAEKEGIMPNPVDCSNLKPNDPAWDNKCKNDFSNNSVNCVKRQLCINKDKASELINIEANHSGAAEKYMNEKMNYDSMLMNAINLGIGIVFLLVIIYKNRK